MRRRSGFDWLALVLGILLMALGVFTLVRPDGALTWVILVYGLGAIAMGVRDVVVYIRIARFTGFGPMLSLISGILSVMCGAMLVANPGLGRWALTVLLPVWFIAHCISGLTHAGFIRLSGRRALYVVSLVLNILGLILGFLMLLSPALSFMTLRVVGYMVAFYLIVFGIEYVVSAFDKWD